MWKLIPELPEIKAYLTRVCERPAFVRATALDLELAKTHEAAVAKG
jgi:glutathione S-transferase